MEIVHEANYIVLSTGRNAVFDLLFASRDSVLFLEKRSFLLSSEDVRGMGSSKIINLLKFSHLFFSQLKPINRNVNIFVVII